MAVGEYNAPKGKWRKAIQGDADPRITQLYKKYLAHVRKFEDGFRKFQISFDKLTESAEKESGIDLTPILAKAIGTTLAYDVDQEVKTRIEDNYDAVLQGIRGNDTLTVEEQNAMSKDATEARAAALNEAKELAVESFKVEQQQAMDQIVRISEPLADKIQTMRNMVDDMSQELKTLYGLDKDDASDPALQLGIKIDSQKGIYLTRTYKMFTEVGYHDRVRQGIIDNDGDYAALREEALSFFRQSYIDMKVEQAVAANKDKIESNKVSELQTMDEARSAAIKEVSVENAARKAAANDMDNNSLEYQALLEFIDSYQNADVGGKITSNSGYQSLVDNLRQKNDDLPLVLRKILGENVNEEAGLVNLLRTYGTVANMASKQALIFNIEQVGIASRLGDDATAEDKFLLTPEEYAIAEAANPEKYSDWKKDNRGMVTKYDTLSGYYAPREMWEHLDAITQRSFTNVSTASDEIAQQAGVIAARISGAAMAAKTLGSVGFYFRNVLSNMLFFGPSQGYWNMGEMLGYAKTHFKQMALKPDEVDAQISEYMGLNILGANMRTTIMHDMLRGKVEISNLMQQMKDLETKEGSLAEVETAMQKAKGKGKAALEATYKKLTDMADAADGFYKIAYFENELKVLREAKRVAPEGTSYYEMTDGQLKMEAAQKVMETAQMASHRLPIIENISSSAVGLMVAPFIGFTSDVFRIPVNTVKLAFKEIKSDNPVIQARGKKRAVGFGIVTTGFSAGIPALLAGMLAGLDNDEQEAIRESLPDYLKRHTFFYWKWGGKIKSLDLTYVNPYAMIIDPLMRSFEQLSRGNFGKAASNIVHGVVTDNFLSEQIAAGSLMSLMRNRDPSTNEMIYDERVDSAASIIGKGIGHVWNKAYEPRTMTTMLDAASRVGVETDEFEQTSTGTMVSMLYPAKIHTVDIDRNFRRMLFTEKEAASNVKGDLLAVYQRKPMSPEDVSDLYFDYYKSQVKLDSRMYNFVKQYGKMGLSENDMYHRMVKMGYGKRRAKNILNGIAEAPSISPRMTQSLQERGLLDRASPLFRAYTQVPKYRYLDRD